MKKYKIRSHPLSKRVLPLLEHKRLVKGLGQVTLIALLVGAAVYPTRAFNYEAVPEGVIGATEIKVTTESAYAFPGEIDDNTAKSQWAQIRGMRTPTRS